VAAQAHTRVDQTIGLTLSLRRLDLLESVYLHSVNPNQEGTSTSVSSKHDEDLLRYVLAEVTGGASGNEGWSKEFRDEVGIGTAL
jgi:26S proteasome regulatory subunit N2